MRIDSIIIKRFEELLEEVKKIPHESGGLNGKTDYIERKAYYKWMTSAMDCIEKVWGKNSNYYANISESYQVKECFASKFRSSVGIFEAAYFDYKQGYMWTYRIALGSELLSDAISQGIELLKAKYKDSACVCGRIALETAIKELCFKNEIPIAKLNKMNEDLCKAGVYNMGTQKQITAWADRGNDAAHGNFNNYSENDVSMMLEGIINFISLYMG